MSLISLHSFQTAIFATNSLKRSTRASVKELMDNVFDQVVGLDRYAYVILCQSEGQVIGSALVEPLHDRYTLQKLCTREDHRLQGVGTSILACLQTLQSKCSLHVDKGPNHDKLRSFYTTRGFLIDYETSHETQMTWDPPRTRYVLQHIEASLQVYN